MRALEDLQRAFRGPKNASLMLREVLHTFQTLDSGAQAKTASDLVTGVQPRHALMDPILVPIGITLYLVLKPMLASLCRSLGTTGKSVTFKVLALSHNLLLCIYSCWTATNVWYLTYVHFRKSGSAIYCDSELWDDGLAYWGFLFYLSKYWELVDTLLLIWKQKEPSYLQVYHHAVTILCGYMLQASHARVTFLFVGLNGTVHAIMYAYFGMSVLGLRWKGKSMITVMQMLQFVVGICLASPTFWLRNGTCATTSQKIAVGAIMAHAAYLIVLFAQFYVRSYRPKGKTE